MSPGRAKLRRRRLAAPSTTGSTAFLVDVCCRLPRGANPPRMASSGAFFADGWPDGPALLAHTSLMRRRAHARRSWWIALKSCKSRLSALDGLRLARAVSRGLSCVFSSKLCVGFGGQWARRGQRHRPGLTPGRRRPPPALRQLRTVTPASVADSPNPKSLQAFATWRGRLHAPIGPTPGKELQKPAVPWPQGWRITTIWCGGRATSPGCHPEAAWGLSCCAAVAHPAEKPCGCCRPITGEQSQRRAFWPVIGATRPAFALPGSTIPSSA